MRKESRQANRSLPNATGRPENAALLLVSTGKGGQSVSCHCERAEAAGVRVGMSLAHARSLLHKDEIWVQGFAPDEDAEALHRLARWALRFSPIVAPEYPDGLLLDIAGCQRLFGGEGRLVEKVAGSLEGLGFPARLAIAPTFGCAWAVARYGKNRTAIISDGAVQKSLAPLPVAALRIGPAMEAALVEVAIVRIGQLFDISRDELAVRFGIELLRRLDQAAGDTVETISPVQHSIPLEVCHTFDGPVSRLDAIQATVEQLLSALVVELEKQNTGLYFLRIAFRRVDMTPAHVSLALAHPSRSRNHLWSLIHPKLERMHWGYGVERIVLRAVQTGRVRHKQMALWSGELSSERLDEPTALGELLDRMMNRLGRNSVTTIEPIETYIPEQAFVTRAFLKTSHYGVCGANGVGKERVFPGNRPSRLFDTPEPARVMALVPDGPPVWLRRRGIESAIVTSNGPERIALPWWTEDRKTVRDYYAVQDEHGQWLWIFRDCHSGRWFVQGEWA